jgi:predicted RNase H-like HicB family nuclease
MSIQSAPADFELVREGDVWVATHVETDVASQGATPNEAVARAEEAARLHDDSYSSGDDAFQREMLEAFNIDPADVADSIDSPDGMP